MGELVIMNLCLYLYQEGFGFWRNEKPPSQNSILKSARGQECSFHCPHYCAPKKASLLNLASNLRKRISRKINKAVSYCPIATCIYNHIHMPSYATSPPTRKPVASQCSEYLPKTSRQKILIPYHDVPRGRLKEGIGPIHERPQQWQHPKHGPLTCHAIDRLYQRGPCDKKPVGFPEFASLGWPVSIPKDRSSPTGAQVQHFSPFLVLGTGLICNLLPEHTRWLVDDSLGYSWYGYLNDTWSWVELLDSKRGLVASSDTVLIVQCFRHQFPRIPIRSQWLRSNMNWPSPLHPSEPHDPLGVCGRLALTAPGQKCRMVEGEEANRVPVSW